MYSSSETTPEDEEERKIQTRHWQVSDKSRFDVEEDKTQQSPEEQHQKQVEPTDADLALVLADSLASGSGAAAVARVVHGTIVRCLSGTLLYYPHMTTVLKQPLPENRLKQLGVKTVYLFGSHAEASAGPESDVDVAVLFAYPLPKDNQTVYQALYEIFADCFDLSEFKTIDIVFLHQVGYELQQNVVRHGKVLFEDDLSARLEFEDNTRMKYLDFKYYLDLQDQAILERI